MRKMGRTCDTLLDLCVSSLRRGHANLLCIVPILTDDLRRGSEIVRITTEYGGNLMFIPKPKEKTLVPHSKHSCFNLFPLVFLSSNFLCFSHLNIVKLQSYPLMGVLPAAVCHAGATSEKLWASPEYILPDQKSCDKQVSSWRHISCHTDKNRYYT